VASSGIRVPEGSALELDDGEHRISVWRVPHDPHLPGLAPLVEPAGAREVLRQVGVPADRVTTRMRAYRPGRRAVVELTAPGVRLYAKVVRPSRVVALRARHEHLAGAVPVPASLGWTDDGVVVLQGLSGRTMRDALLGKGPVPRYPAIRAVLDGLPPPPGEPGPPDWGVERFSALLRGVVPELGDRLDALAEPLLDAQARAAELPAVPVHGDLHEAQLLTDGGRITGLLDVDTYGWGRRIDDLATMVGHLATLAVATNRRGRIEAHAKRFLDQADRAVDPSLLRAAVASVVLGLATGPFRVLEPQWRRNTEARVALAERWLDSSVRAASLISA
jgi:hypothetical protein